MADEPSAKRVKLEPEGNFVNIKKTTKHIYFKVYFRGKSEC